MAINLRKKIFLVGIFILILLSSNKKGETVIRAVPFPKPFLIFEDLGSMKIPNKYINLYGQHTIGQIFVSKFPNLCRIGIFILKEKKDTGALIFHLRPSINSPQDIVRIKVEGKNLHDNYYPFTLPPLDTKGVGSFYFFEFEPISLSINQPFYFYLESPDSREDNGIKIGYSMNIYNRGYVYGPTYLNGNPQEWYLNFQTYSAWNGSVANVLKTIFRRLGGDINFVIFHSLLCLSLLIGIFIINHKLKLIR